MSNQTTSKFLVSTERFIPDDLCQYINKDLEFLENISEVVVKPILEKQDIILSDDEPTDKLQINIDSPPVSE